MQALGNEPHNESPALRALVVYFHPAPRPDVLRSLAELGVFVSECTSQEAEREHVGPLPDFLVMYGPCYSRDHAVVARLASKLSPTVVVAAITNEDAELFEAAGAIAFATGTNQRDLPADVIAAGAFRARALHPPVAVDGS